MIPFLVFLGFVLVAETGTSTSDDDDTVPTPPEPDPEIVPIPVNDADTVAGTDGDDVFVPAEGTTAFNTVAIDGGAGNDTFNLTDPSGDDPSFDFIFQGPTIAGGEGDDTIDITASGGTIDGGVGDDAINVNIGDNTTVLGGEGNDTISGLQFASDGITIEGGAGDDFIDARNMENVQASGGEGDDTILVSDFNQPGAGYVSRADGGAGEDLLRFEGSASQIGELTAQTMFGGEGTDRFEIAFDEGEGAIEDETLLAEVGRFEQEVVNIGDFEPGVETIVLDPNIANEGFTITQGSLTEDAEAGTTTMVIRYESDTAATRDLVFVIGATGVDWDDISFIDNAPETLFLNGVEVTETPAVA